MWLAEIRCEEERERRCIQEAELAKQEALLGSKVSGFCTKCIIIMIEVVSDSERAGMVVYCECWEPANYH
jgi:hypothetical protein